jgi:hypothetical protein
VSFALQALLVALLVGACALYSTWRLLSGRARLRALELLAGVPGIGRAAWLAALRARVVQGTGSCGGCAGASAAAPKRTSGALRR